MARYFVQFKPNSSLANKLMVFTGMTEAQVRNEVTREYGDSVVRIFDEATVAQILPNIYCCKEQWVEFGAECVYTKRDCDGNSVAEFKYPVSKNTKPYKQHTVDLQSMFDWFKTAKPMPTQKDLPTQIGAHFEEVSELTLSLTNSLVIPELDKTKVNLYHKLLNATQALQELSKAFYEDPDFEIHENERVATLDALADQVVTLSGVAYFANMKWNDALTEVNQSNYSKFEEGKPLLNENRKIMKGKDYFSPELDKYV